MLLQQPNSTYSVSQYAPLTQHNDTNTPSVLYKQLNNNELSDVVQLHRSHSHTNTIHSQRPSYVTALLLFVWMCSAIASTLTNKTLMNVFPYSVTLTLIHLLASVTVDSIIIYYRNLSLLPFNKQLFIQTLPVAAAINFSKTLTYMSYGYVPASLTHTAKASSPIFSVIISKLMYNKLPSNTVCLSLIPITVGVTLSALTEINFVLFGFICAVIAAVAAVLNTLYGKQALHHTSCPDPIIFHFYASVSAVLMVAPYAIIHDGSEIYHSIRGQASISDGLVHMIPFQMIIFSLSMHYIQNITSVYYLAGTTVLTHQVVGTAKRLVVIASTVLYFGNPVGLMNALGMMIAVAGYLCYGIAKSYVSKPVRHHKRTDDISLEMQSTTPNHNKSLSLVQQSGIHARRPSNATTPSTSPVTSDNNDTRINMNTDHVYEMQQLLRPSDSEGNMSILLSANNHQHQFSHSSRYNSYINTKHTSNINNNNNGYEESRQRSNVRTPFSGVSSTSTDSTELYV